LWGHGHSFSLGSGLGNIDTHYVAHSKIHIELLFKHIGEQFSSPIRSFAATSIKVT
jgi:hypothetical protein